MIAVAAVLSVALAVASSVGTAEGARRRRVLAASSEVGGHAWPPRQRPDTRRKPRPEGLRPVRWMPLAVTVSVLVVFAWPWGLLLAPMSWWLTRCAVRWRLRVLVRRAADDEAVSWSLAADLIAAGLAAGVDLRVVTDEVGAVLGGGPGRLLRLAASDWALGARSDGQWRARLSRASPAGARLAAMLAAGDSAGIPPVVGLRTLAVDLRARDAARRSERARRAGIAAVAPLGLCFLPAFVLVGIVPLIAASLHGLSL